MSDIVDRLLKEGALEGSYDVPAIQRQAAEEIKLLRQVCARLSSDLSKAQLDIVDWIEKTLHLSATNMEQSYALRRIGMPGKDIGYCRDGHEMAVLIARDALKESKT
jgi:hypothetical protein